MNMFSEKITSILEQYANSKIEVLCSHYGIDLEEAKKVIADSETNEIIADNKPKRVKKKRTTRIVPTTPFISPPTFEINDDNWLSFLEEEGFVVIRDAISETNMNTAVQMFKNDYTKISPKWDWDNAETWTTNNSPMMWGKGASTFNGIGQSDSLWYLRLNSVAKTAFSKIYNTDELVTSFDGASVFVSETQKSPSWLHQDQNRDNKLLSVQGILNLLKCDQNDAGFVCVPKSHKSYLGAKSKKDWILVPNDDPILNDVVKILTPPRSLILFNSRLIHANTGMSKNHPDGVHINRISAYITFAPASRRDNTLRNKRIQAYYDGETTSHWPSKFEPKKIPFTVSKNYKERNLNHILPTLTENNDIPSERLLYI